jgi:DNA-binding MarR family transcriptional regulator
LKSRIEVGSGVSVNSNPKAARGGDTTRRAARATRVWRDLLELDSSFHTQKGIRILTPEARVLIQLRLNGPMSVTTAMEQAGTSYRGFYAVLERLRQAGIISTVKDDQDQRVRKLSIDPSVPSLP